MQKHSETLHKRGPVVLTHPLVPCFSPFAVQPRRRLPCQLQSSVQPQHRLPLSAAPRGLQPAGPSSSRGAPASPAAASARRLLRGGHRVVTGRPGSALFSAFAGGSPPAAPPPPLPGPGLPTPARPRTPFPDHNPAHGGPLSARGPRPVPPPGTSGPQSGRRRWEAVSPGSFRNPEPPRPVPARIRPKGGPGRSAAWTSGTPGFAARKRRLRAAGLVHRAPFLAGKQAPRDAPPDRGAG